MKKLVLLLTIPLLAAGLQAQTQTTPIVSTTDIIFNMCPHLETNESAIVCHESDVPFVWNGITTIPSEKDPGVYQLQRDILNDEGCTVNATMDLTVATCHPEGAILHKFSVGENKYVYFSKGNLQYRATADGVTAYDPVNHPEALKHKVAGGGYARGEWSFAEKQYTILSTRNDYYNPNYNPTATTNNLIDLFGWGTSGYNDKNPWSSSNNSSLYAPISSSGLCGNNAYYDWGVYNAISNGGNEPGIWRTLTKEEWSYLMYSRCGSATNAQNHWLGAKITISGNTYYGLVLIPDDWVEPESGLWDWTTVSSSSRIKRDFSYDESSWKTMEKSGAVFLPTYLYRSNTSTLSNYSSSSTHYGYYWSATAESSYATYSYWHTNGQTPTTSTQSPWFAFPVRLVTDVKPCDN